MSDWYARSYRRLLVDMHIADPRDDLDWRGDDRYDDEFLSCFSPQTYVENMRRAHIDAAMIYTQSHAGHCYFPTKVGHMHSALRGREDMMRETVRLCHEAGMHAVGYYSLVFNTYEEDRHPDWRIVVGEDKRSSRDRGGRYGMLCPNNPDYRAFVAEQIREIAEYFTFDGMFYDMTYWPGVCRCPHCMKVYASLGFDDVPHEDPANPEYIRFMSARNESIGDFARFVTETTRRLMPGVSVEHNYAFAVASDGLVECSTERVNDWCDYTGGDLYGDLYNHSFTAKYYYAVSRHQPFEYMTCRCDRTLTAHTDTKTEEHLATEVMLTVAHHGASLIIDAIDPRGTSDSRVYERIGRVFERQMPYEGYFSGEMRCDVGVYYSTSGRYNTHGASYHSKDCSLGAVRAMVESHIPVGIVSNATTSALSSHRMVLSCALAGISEENREDLIRYVEEGGILYLSGVEEPELLRRLLGGTCARFTEETAVYLAPTEQGQALFGEFNRDFPLPTEYRLPVLTLDNKDIEVLAVMKLPYTAYGERRFASIHSDPPGVLTDLPALLSKKVGKGTVVWSAAPIERDGRLSHKRLLTSVVRHFMGEPSLITDAPRQVETVTFVRPSAHDLLVSAVDLLCTDELLPIRPFEIALTVPSPVKGVSRITGDGEVPLPFTYRQDLSRVTFSVPSLVMFDMFRITL